MGLLSILVPLIPGIIQGVELLHGAKKGREKKELAVNMASTAVKQLRDKGQFEGDENALDVAQIVEIGVMLMKTTGLLQEVKEPGSVPATPTSQRVVFEGTLRHA